MSKALAKLSEVSGPKAITSLPKILPPAKMAKIVDYFAEVERRLKDMEDHKERAVGAIVDYADEQRQALARQRGQLVPSVVILGREDAVRVVTKKAYSPIPKDNEKLLRRQFGEDFDRYFTMRAKVSFSEEALRDEEFVAALSKVVSKYGKPGYVTVDTYLYPTDRYHTSRYFPEIIAAERVLGGIIKQHAATVQSLSEVRE